MEYGERIATLRKTKGMTQSELGNELNVTFQAVSKWERGESYPDFATMSKIAKLFDVPITYFEDGIIPEQTAPEPTPPAPVPVAAPAPVLLGICSKCGKGIYSEEEIAQKEPALLCKTCHEQRKEQINAMQRKDKQRAHFWRNLGLIVSGAICLAIIIFYVTIIIRDPTTLWGAVGSCCLLVFFLFPFIAQLFWRGLVVDIVLCGGKIIGGPGVIFTLDIDGITFLIVFKLCWLVIKVLFFILTIIFFTLIGIIVSPFSFIPAVIKLSKGNIDF